MTKIPLIMQQTHIGTLLNKKLDLSLSMHGINFTEFTVMYNLYMAQNKKLSRSSLAEKVGLTASGITRVLLPMDKNHLVTKESNPRDARQSLVVITDVGIEVLQNAQITVEHSADVILSLLDQDELSLLINLLNKMKC